MSTFPRCVALLLGLFSLLLASTPIDALSSLGPASAEDSCCTERPAEDSAVQPSADVPSAEDDGCCPSDCHGCFLKCCAGLLSLRPARLTILPDEAPRPATPESNHAPVSVARRAIEHPPKR